MNKNKIIIIIILFSIISISISISSSAISQTWNGTEYCANGRPAEFQYTEYPNSRVWSDCYNDSISIPKSLDVGVGYRSLHPYVSYSKQALQNNMINVNASVAYLNFPYSLNKVKDWADDRNIKHGKWLFRAGNEHITISDINGTVLNSSYYDFRIVSDEIRLYFLKSEANKLNDTITFKMNSWEWNNSTSPAWNGTTLTNMTVDACNGSLQLKDQITNGLVGYWTMDNCWRDQSDQGNHGTGYGGVEFNSSGRFGAAGQFDGVDDIITTPINLSGMSNISLAYFIKTQNISQTYARIISSEISIFNGTRIMINNQNIVSCFEGQSTEQCDTMASVVSADTWGYGVLVANTTNISHFWNGVLFAMSAQPYGTSSGLVTISATQYINNRYFNGTLDEVRIYNRALSNDEINLTMNNSKYASGNAIFNTTFAAGQQGSTWLANVSGLNSTIVMNGSSSIANVTYTTDCLTCANNTNYTISSKNQTQWIKLDVSGNNSTMSLFNFTIYDEIIPTPTPTPIPLPTHFIPAISNFSTNNTYAIYNTENNTIQIQLSNNSYLLVYSYNQHIFLMLLIVIAFCEVFRIVILIYKEVTRGKI